MIYTVKFTDTAKDDLREIALWIAGKASDVGPAKKFVQELKSECLKLNTFPNSGAYPQDRILRSLGYRFIEHKGYLIFYLTDDEQHLVNIMAIFNEKKDYSRMLNRFI